MDGNTEIRTFADTSRLVGRAKDKNKMKQEKAISAENSTSNLSNVQYYFRGSVKCVISYPLGIRSRIIRSRIVERSSDILNKEYLTWNIGKF